MAWHIRALHVSGKLNKQSLQHLYPLCTPKGIFKPYNNASLVFFSALFILWSCMLLVLFLHSALWHGPSSNPIRWHSILSISSGQVRIAQCIYTDLLNNVSWILWLRFPSLLNSNKTKKQDNRTIFITQCNNGFTGKPSWEWDCKINFSNKLPTSKCLQLHNSSRWCLLTNTIPQTRTPANPLININSIVLPTQLSLVVQICATRLQCSQQLLLGSLCCQTSFGQLSFVNLA